MESTNLVKAVPVEGETREYKDGTYIFKNGHFHKVRKEGDIIKEIKPAIEGETKEFSDGTYKYEGGHWKKQYTIEQLLIKKFKENFKTDFDKKAVISWFSSKIPVQEIVDNLSKLVKIGVVQKIEKPIDLNKSAFRYIFLRDVKTTVTKEDVNDSLKELFKHGDVISEEVTGEELK